MTAHTRTRALPLSHVPTPAPPARPARPATSPPPRHGSLPFPSNRGWRQTLWQLSQRPPARSGRQLLACHRTGTRNRRGGPCCPLPPCSVAGRPAAGSRSADGTYWYSYYKVAGEGCKSPRGVLLLGENHVGRAGCTMDVAKLVSRQLVCTALQPECTYTCVPEPSGALGGQERGQSAAPDQGPQTGLLSRESASPSTAQTLFDDNTRHPPDQIAPTATRCLHGERNSRP